MQPRLLASIAIAGSCAISVGRPAHATPPRFSITIAPSTHSRPLTGRLVLAIAKTAQPQPRLVISPRGPALFAIDLSSLAPGAPALIDEHSLRYPRSLAELPPADYFAQAIVNVYEQVHRADGKAIWVHMNDGRVAFFSNAAGNLYSDVIPVHVAADGVIAMQVTHVVPPSAPLTDTE